MRERGRTGVSVGSGVLPVPLVSLKGLPGRADLHCSTAGCEVVVLVPEHPLSVTAGFTVRICGSPLGIAFVTLQE